MRVPATAQIRPALILLAAVLATLPLAHVVVHNPELTLVSGVLSVWGLATALAGLAICAVALRYPGFALVLLVAVVYLNLSEVLVRQHHVPSLLQLIYLPVLVGALLALASGGRLILRANALIVLLLLYVVILFDSTVVARDRALADTRVLEHVKAFAIFFAVVLLARSPRLIRQASWTTVAAAAVLGGLGLLQVATRGFANTYGGFARVKYAQIYGDVFEPRIAGPLGDPNFFAQMLIMAVPVALFLTFTERTRLLRVTGWAAAGITACAVVFSYSRGGAIALVCVLLLSLLAWKAAVGQAAVAAVVGLIALLWVVMPAQFARRLMTLEQVLPIGNGEVLDPDSSIEERKLFTAVAGRLLVDHPIVGVGAGNYTAYFTEYAERVGSTTLLYVDAAEGYYPHNLYLEIGAETGLIGLAVFCAALVASFAQLRRARRRFFAAGDVASAGLARGWTIALTGYLLTSLFLHGAFIRYLWLVFAFSAALAHAASSLHAGGERLASGPIKRVSPADLELTRFRGHLPL